MNMFIWDMCSYIRLWLTRIICHTAWIQNIKYFLRSFVKNCKATQRFVVMRSYFPNVLLYFCKKLLSLLQGFCNNFHSAETYHILEYMKNVRQWNNSLHYKQLKLTFHKLNKMFSIKLVGSIKYCTFVH